MQRRAKNGRRGKGGKTLFARDPKTRMDCSRFGRPVSGFLRETNGSLAWCGGSCNQGHLVASGPLQDSGSPLHPEFS